MTGSGHSHQQVSQGPPRLAMTTVGDMLAEGPESGDEWKGKFKGGNKGGNDKGGGNINGGKGGCWGKGGGDDSSKGHTGSPALRPDVLPVERAVCVSRLVGMNVSRAKKMARPAGRRRRRQRQPTIIANSAVC